MLTGNEPVSAGNLRAAFGGLGRAISTTSGSAHKENSSGGSRMNGPLDLSILGGGAPDFTASGTTLTCQTAGDYAISGSVQACILGCGTGGARMYANMMVTRGSTVATVPLAGFSSASSEGEYPSKFASAPLCYRAHLEAGDAIEFRYAYTTSTQGSNAASCSARVGFYIERLR